jgi:hypothetical protein
MGIYGRSRLYLYTFNGIAFINQAINLVTCIIGRNNSYIHPLTNHFVGDVFHIHLTAAVSGEKIGRGYEEDGHFE